MIKVKKKKVNVIIIIITEYARICMNVPEINKILNIPQVLNMPKF